jgi:amino acid permease
LFDCACSAPIITLEVADTLRQPPAAATSMKKSLLLGLGTCLLLFGLSGVLGYLALGDAVSGSLLLAFQDSAPAWVIIVGSLMVILNMVPAYQVRPQPQRAYLVCVLRTHA